MQPIILPLHLFVDTHLARASEARTLLFLLEYKPPELMSLLATAHRTRSHRQLTRALVAVAAGLLQLHLFMVMELHHHQTEVPATSRHSVRATLESSQGADTPCPACQIARQGSVNAPPQGLALVEPSKTLSVSPARPVRYSDLPKARPSGRDPPVVS